MPIPYPVENARHNYAVDNGKPQGAKLAAAMADKPVQRTSLREKLETFKAKVSGTDKLSIEKRRGRRKRYNDFIIFEIPTVSDMSSKKFRLI